MKCEKETKDTEDTATTAALEEAITIILHRLERTQRDLNNAIKDIDYLERRVRQLEAETK